MICLIEIVFEIPQIVTEHRGAGACQGFNRASDSKAVGSDPTSRIPGCYSPYCQLERLTSWKSWNEALCGYGSADSQQWHGRVFREISERPLRHARLRKSALHPKPSQPGLMC